MAVDKEFEMVTKMMDLALQMANEYTKGLNGPPPDPPPDMFTADQLRRLQDLVDRQLTLEEVNELARVYEQALTEAA